MEAMKVFEVEDGAMYWVAAPDLQSAVLAMSQCYADTGDGWPEDYFRIDEVFPKRAKEIEIKDDGTDTKHSAWALAQECTKAQVLGCSEWP